jgi:beta-lactam-binding protein with PASTA domain
MAVLAAAGLNVGTVTATGSSAPEGSVINQGITAGTSIGYGSSVNLWISGGSTAPSTSTTTSTTFP